MKEILFRGKSITGEWIFGSLIVFGERTFIYPINGSQEDYHFYGYEVIPETVGQFTRMTDINGKKIFEGDIVKSTFHQLHDDTKHIIIGIVEDDLCNPCFVIRYKFEGTGHDCYEYDFVQCGLRTNEVVGNTFDNPELLTP